MEAATKEKFQQFSASCGRNIKIVKFIERLRSKSMQNSETFLHTKYWIKVETFVSRAFIEVLTRAL